MFADFRLHTASGTNKPSLNFMNKNVAHALSAVAIVLKQFMTSSTITLWTDPFPVEGVSG